MVITAKKSWKLFFKIQHGCATCDKHTAESNLSTKKQ